MKPHGTCLIHSACLSLFLLIASTRHAHAYVDPGTGSYVIQLLIAALAGIALAVRIYWQRIKRFFSGSSPDTSDTGSDDE